MVQRSTAVSLPDALASKNSSITSTLPSAIAELDRGNGFLFVKSSRDGRTTFEVNRAFETCISSRRSISEAFEAKVRPGTKRFLHQEDVPKVCEIVGHMWSNVKDGAQSDPSSGGKTVTLLLPALRLWLPAQQVYIPCSGAARLLVGEGDGCVSHLGLLFTPIQCAPSELQPLVPSAAMPHGGVPSPVVTHSVGGAPEHAKSQASAWPAGMRQEASRKRTRHASPGAADASAPAVPFRVTPHGALEAGKDAAPEEDLTALPPLDGFVMDENCDLGDIWIAMSEDDFNSQSPFQGDFEGSKCAET